MGNVDTMKPTHPKAMHNFISMVQLSMLKIEVMTDTEADIFIKAHRSVKV